MIVSLPKEISIPPRLRSVLISHKLTPLYGMNLCGYGADAAAIRAEIDAAEETLKAIHKNVHLISLDISDTTMTAEIAVMLSAFLLAHPGSPGDPLQKLAVIGVPSAKRLWWELKWKIKWPPTARFFTAQEEAKAWLIGER